jgi:hypothetical protein
VAAPAPSVTSVGYREFDPETLKRFDELSNEYLKLENLTDPASVKKLEQVKEEYAKLQNQGATQTTEKTIIPAPETPTVPLTTEVGKAPKEMPMVEQAAGNPEKNALAEERKTQPAPVKKTPAAPQKQTFKSIAEIPEGVVFKEGFGGADSWLNDQVGKEKAKAIRNTFNQGRGFGSGADAIKNAATALGEFGNTQFMTQGEPLILSK